MKISHCGDIHIEEDRYFADTTQCLEWFVEDSIRANTNLFVVNGDLTTYKATIKERRLTNYHMSLHPPSNIPEQKSQGTHKGKSEDG